MTAIATTRIPTPLIVDGAVTNDVPSRTLVVRLSESAGGYAQLLWREVHQALVKAQESGWRTSAPTLWGGALGNRQIVHGLPGDYQTLLFHFRAGESVYSELVGKPGLTATVALDRKLCHFMNVQFLNRRT